jgi:hypothetical protein
VIFGGKEKFAIEIEPERIPQGVWGTMRSWCRGQPVGDLQQFDTLWGISEGIRDSLLPHFAELWDDSLAGLDDRRIVDFLSPKLFWQEGDPPDLRTAEEMQDDARRYGKFCLFMNWTAHFDGFSVFVHRPSSGGVRISYRLLDGTYGGGEVSEDEFLQPLREFALWFDNEHARSQEQA